MSDGQYVWDEKTIEDAAEKAYVAHWDTSPSGSWSRLEFPHRAPWMAIARAILATVAAVIAGIRRERDAAQKHARELVDLCGRIGMAVKLRSTETVGQAVERHVRSAERLLEARNDALATVADREATISMIGRTIGRRNEETTIEAAQRIMAELAALRARDVEVTGWLARMSTALHKPAKVESPAPPADVCAARHLHAAHMGVDDGAVPCVACDVGTRQPCKPAEDAPDPDADVIAHRNAYHEKCPTDSAIEAWSDVPEIVRVRWRRWYLRSIRGAHVAVSRDVAHDDGPGPANESEPEKWRSPDDFAAQAKRDAGGPIDLIDIADAIRASNEQTAAWCERETDASIDILYVYSTATPRDASKIAALDAQVACLQRVARMLRGASK